MIITKYPQEIYKEITSKISAFCRKSILLWQTEKILIIIQNKFIKTRADKVLDKYCNYNIAKLIISH